MSDNKVVYVFTDGSCIENGFEGSVGGIGVYIPSIERRETQSLSDVLNHYGIEDTTSSNNRAELMAVYKAVDIIDEIYGKTRDDKMKISFVMYVDSVYTINCLTKWYVKWVENGWRTGKNQNVKNRDIIQPLLAKLRDNFDDNLSFVHINSHTKEPINGGWFERFIWNGNDIADKLATQSVSKQ
jgi:ribonuclease HI